MAIRGQFQVLNNLPVAADMTGHKYKAVKVSSGQAALVTASDGDGFDAFGVIQDEPDTAGRVAEVVIFGFTKMVAGEAISVGDNLMVEGSDTAASSGRVKVATRNGTTEASEAILGRALSAATAANQVIEAFVMCAPCLVANRTG